MTPNWPLGAVSLKVLHLEAETTFYRKLGLSVLDGGADWTVLGVAGGSLLRLRALDKKGAKRPPYSAGLYHLGFRLASESELGTFLWRVMDEGLHREGSTDHGFAQSFYFTSPDGNGIEVFADKVQEDGLGQVATRSTQMVDDELLAKGHRGDGEGLGVNTVVGHLHLNVADLDKSAKFYGKLGMKIIGVKDARMRYLGWDDYRHIAINLLEGAGASKIDENESGLEGFESYRVSGKKVDPDGIVVRGTQD